MNCRERQKQISMLADGELGEVAAIDLRNHVTSCRECSEFMKSVAAVNETLRSLPSPAPRPGLNLAIKAAVEEKFGTAPRPIGMPRWAQVAVYGAAIITALGVGKLAGRSMSDVIVSGAADHTYELSADLDSGASFVDLAVEIGAKERTR